MPDSVRHEVVQSSLAAMKTQNGEILQDLLGEQALLLVFLRPFGCIFCMESMKDLGHHRPYIEGKGVKICCVHMASHEVAESYFKDYGLQHIDHVSDQDCQFYSSFGLLKGNFSQLSGLKIWLRTAQLAASDLRRLRMKQIGDGFQMPGVFYLENDAIVRSYIHRRTSDRPDYRKMIANS